MKFQPYMKMQESELKLLILVTMTVLIKEVHLIQVMILSLCQLNC